MKEVFDDIRSELSKAIVGQNEVIDGLLRAVLAQGHVIVEGVPGIAKTLLVRSLAEVMGVQASRIQFTVDLLPTDITGMTTFTPGRGMSTVKGPLFANFIIADELNRAPPKTQSALLEAMQEKQVTIGKTTYPLQSPFFVMATLNPIESTGTYNLPEAQVDRFLFKLKVTYPSKDDEKAVLDKNMTIRGFEDFKLKRVITGNQIKKLQKECEAVHVSDKLREYIVSIVDATRNPEKYGIKCGKYIEWGASPRASIALYVAAKADAFLSGKKFASPQNVKNIAHDVLRHRILLNYAGQAEKITADQIVQEILDKIEAH